LVSLEAVDELSIAISMKKNAVESAPMHGHRHDPYRVFFPLGIVLGIAGVAIWPLYYYGVTEGYSGRAHAFVQIEGFLYCFAIGFLLTAIPRFTGTDVPSRTIQYALAALLVTGAAAFEVQNFRLGQTTFLVSHMTVVALAARRFAQRQQNPPPTFILIGIGLISGAAAAIINAGVEWNIVDPSWDTAGKRLLTEGMFLMLVLGVGGFLGPRLLGFAELPQMTGRGLKMLKRSSERVIAGYGAAGVALLLTVIVEYRFRVRSMALLRAAIATTVLVATMRPWRTPATRTTLGWCVWTANWLVLTGVWLSALAPRYRVDFLHVLLIGGFTLLVLAVGTRVVLSHGGYSLARERASWPLRIGLATGLLAMASRIGAPFAAFSYFEHLAFAGICWIAGMSVWGAYLINLLRTEPRRGE
jgi:uncharacterized protein involved in response to NO